MKLPAQAPPVSRDSLGTNSLALSSSVDPSWIYITGNGQFQPRRIGMHQIITYAHNNGIALDQNTRNTLRNWAGDDTQRPPFNTIADAIRTAYLSTQMVPAN